MSPLLSARSVTFHRHGEPVFAPADLELPPGQACVILGANGSGKTTLLRLLAGILAPAAGHLELFAQVTFIGHLPAVKADLTCRENLNYERALGPPAMAVNQALAQVGLAGFGLRPARTLSAGQKKRLGLARLLVRQSPLWLLDEPYASLDDAGCDLVDQLLDRHLENRGAAALATHQRLPRITADPAVVRLDGQSSLRSASPRR